MKLILYSSSVVFLFLSSCVGVSSEIARSPSSISSGMSLSNKTDTPTTNTMDTYLMYKLIKDSGFGNIDTQDCKGYAQRNAIHCKSKDCKAVINQQETDCEDPACKAIISDREELCPDQVCRALVSNLPEKCGTDTVCLSLVTKESSQCRDNRDCRAFIDKTGVSCQTNKCKGIINENQNFCE